MPPPSQQQQGGGDTSLGPFWVIIGLFALAGGVWFFAHEQIAFVLLKIKLFEAGLISLFSDQAQTQVAMIKNTDAASASFQTLADISSSIGDYLKYPVAIILGLLGVIIYLSNPTMNFKKTYNMQMMIDREKNSWPQINPVASTNLVEIDIDKGPWAMALLPMQFAKKYNLMILERVIPQDGFSSQAKIVTTLKREEAHRVFALQVGRYWPGLDRLNIHTKALFAIFAARANRDKEGPTNLLRQIAASTTTGKLNFSGVNELLNKHKNNSAVQKVMKSHAFTLTLMASMLQLARTDGIFATADFLWLKPVDRALWFMLNSVGRQTPHTEIAGPFAHWLAELKFGRKLMVPVVDEAVNALEAALRDIMYVPEEEEG